MYDHIKIHKCLHCYMKLVHAVHNRVIFYVILFGGSIAVRCFFVVVFFFLFFVDLSFITFLNNNGNKFFVLFLFIDYYFNDDNTKEIHRCGWYVVLFSLRYNCLGRRLRDHSLQCNPVRVYARIYLYVLYIVVLYTMQVLIDNAFCRQYQRQSTQCIVLFLL